ncbi:MAG: S-layer homology domain-containing protein [Clostridiales bacterium]|nr:S-layer homology domain-containing protein [Clostridiales bacterium]
MRQKSKKWMAVALSLAMLIAMLPSAALAEAPQEADSSPSSRTTADPDQSESPEIKPVIDGDKEVEVIIHGKPSALIVDLPDKTCFRAKPGGRAGEWVKDRGNSTSAATLEQVDDHTVRVILPKGKTFEKGQVITAYQAILVGTTLRSSPFVTYTVAEKPTVIQPMPDANGNLAATPDGYARITFDPTGEGSLVGQKKGEPASFDVLLGTSWAAAKAAGVTVPQDPTHSHPNMQFKGWTNLPADDGTVNEGLTITANFVELSNQDVIPYVPADPTNPINLDDTKVPTKDKDGKIVDKSLYDIVAFTVADADKAKGSLILGDKTDQQVISALIKKDSTWDKVTAPTIKVVDGTTTKANGYDPAIPAGTEPVETGKVYTAQFITNGQEITPGAKLPDGVFEVKVSRDESSVAANDLYGKSYAVFKDSKLGQDKFPTLEAADNFKEAKWYKDAETKATADPSAVGITANTTFTAKAVSSTFDKDKVTKIEIRQAPTKMTYTEGEKPNHDGLKIQLTDQNANTVDIAKDQLADYGVTVTPAETVKLTVNDHQGRPFIARAKDKDGTPLTAKTKADITVKVKAPAQNKSSHRSKTIQKPEAKPAPKPETKPETKPEVKPESKLSNHDLNKAGHYSYLTGYPDGTFAPNKGMTRAEVASLFTRLLKDRPLKGQSYKAGLTDVYAGDWYADAVGYAVQKGIVSGYPDGSFKPNQAISRGEFAAIAARFADMTGDQHPAFSDLDPNHWSYQAIRQVAANGWLSGYPDGSFKPNQPITRAEVATVSNRMLNRTPDLDRLKAHTADLPQYNDVGPGDWFYGAIMEAGFDRP